MFVSHQKGHLKRLKQPDTFKIKEIGFHMDSSQETLKGGFVCPTCCCPATKRSHFCIGLLLVIKFDPLRKLQGQKIICETRPTSQINGKAEYPWREGNALYLVGSKRGALLWASKTWWNHHLKTLPNTINSFEKSNSQKTPGICDQAGGNNFSYKIAKNATKKIDKSTVFQIVLDRNSKMGPSVVMMENYCLVSGRIFSTSNQKMQFFCCIFQK